MPAKECENGKWKWGDTGECIYESEQEAIDENQDYEENKEKINIWDKKFNDTMEKRIINIETTLETREQE